MRLGHALLQLMQFLLHAQHRLHRPLHLLVAGAVGKYVRLLGQVDVYKRQGIT